MQASTLYGLVPIKPLRQFCVCKTSYLPQYQAKKSDATWNVSRKVAFVGSAALIAYEGVWSYM